MKLFYLARERSQEGNRRFTFRSVEAARMDNIKSALRNDALARVDTQGPIREAPWTLLTNSTGRNAGTRIAVQTAANGLTAPARSALIANTPSALAARESGKQWGFGRRQREQHDDDRFCILRELRCTQEP